MASTGRGKWPFFTDWLRSDKANLHNTPTQSDGPDQTIWSDWFFDAAAGGSVTGSGILTDQTADVTGAGLVTSLGTDGTIASQVSTLAGSGLSTSLTTDGAISSAIATLAGAGTVSSASISGTGTMIATGATLDGLGASLARS